MSLLCDMPAIRRSGSSIDLRTDPIITSSAAALPLAAASQCCSSRLSSSPSSRSAGSMHIDQLFADTTPPDDAGPSSSSAVSDSALPFVGLVNSGNTCYFNSFVQTLFASPELHNQVLTTLCPEGFQLDSAVDNDDDGQALVRELVRLFLRLRLRRNNRPVEAIACLQQIMPKGISIRGQQDIQECFRWFTESLQETSKENSKLIDDLYSGRQLATTTCKTCGYVSRTEWPISDLQVPIQPIDPEAEPYSNLMEALRATSMRTETLTGDNQYFCEKCNEKRDADRFEAFSQLPYLLGVHLLRFTCPTATGKCDKIRTRFSFPLEGLLDLSEFVVPSNNSSWHGSSCVDDSASMSSLDDRDAEDEVEDAVSSRLPGDVNSMGSLSTIHQLDTTASGVEIGTDFIDHSDAQPQYYTELEPNLAESAKMELVVDPDKTADAALDVDDDVTGEEAAAAVNTPASKKTSMDSGLNASELAESLAPDRFKWFYQLYAIIVHSGGGSFGHYHAFVRSFTDHQWYKFNDNLVSRASLSDLEEESFGASKQDESFRGANKGAYMMMYRRVDDTNQSITPDHELPPHVAQLMTEIAKADEAAELAEASQSTPSSSSRFSCPPAPSPPPSSIDLSLAIVPFKPADDAPSPSASTSTAADDSDAHSRLLSTSEVSSSVLSTVQPSVGPHLEAHIEVSDEDEPMQTSSSSTCLPLFPLGADSAPASDALLQQLDSRAHDNSYPQQPHDSTVITQQPSPTPVFDWLASPCGIASGSAAAWQPLS